MTICSRYCSSNSNIHLDYDLHSPLAHDGPIKSKHFPSYWPFVRGRYFLWSAPQQTVEQIIETPLIWDAIAPIMNALNCPGHFPDNLHLLCGCWTQSVRESWECCIFLSVTVFDAAIYYCNIVNELSIFIGTLLHSYPFNQIGYKCWMWYKHGKPLSFVTRFATLLSTQCITYLC